MSEGISKAVPETASIAVPLSWHQSYLSDWLARAAEQKLAHALLLTGPVGVGKQRLANALAQALLCQQSTGLACGQCQSCHLAAAGTHPDLHILLPDEGKRLIRVDQVRELVDFAMHTPQYDGYRVAIIEPAQALNRNAQNALLKTLEEPGKDTLILLLSDQPSLLLPTIRSRCQQVALPLPAMEQALEYLVPRVGDDGHARALLAAAGGAPLKALSLDGESWFADREKLLSQCLALLEQRQPVSTTAARFLEYEPLTLLEALALWWQQAAAMTAERAKLADPVLLPLFRRLRGRCDRLRLLECASQALSARSALIAGANPNPELMMEQLLLRLAGVDALEQAF